MFFDFIVEAALGGSDVIVHTFAGIFVDDVARLAFTSPTITRAVIGPILRILRILAILAYDWLNIGNIGNVGNTQTVYIIIFSSKVLVFIDFIYVFEVYLSFFSLKNYLKN